MAPSRFRLEPIPDEVIFGLSIQVGVLKGARTYGECLQLVFSNKRKDWFDPGDADPKRLGQLCDFVNIADIQQLLSKHSVWPYWIAFQNVSMSDVLELARSGVSPVMALGLCGFQAIDETRYAKYCKYCATAQFKKYGRTTWLRSHQLPGVTTCYRHGITLSSSNLWLYEQGRLKTTIEFPDPDEATMCNIDLPDGGSNDWSTKDPYRLWAEISHDCLYSDGRFSDKRKAINFYRGKLSQIGLLTEKGFDFQKIESAFHLRYGELFPKKIGFDFRFDSSCSWLKKLLSGKEYFRQPARHLLLLGVICESFPSGAEFESHGGACIDAVNSKQFQPVILRARDLAKMRDQVVQILTSNPSFTRSQLRGALGRWNYQWMTQHDGVWLDTQIKKRPSPRPVVIADWESRSARLLKVVSHLTAEQKSSLFFRGALNVAELARYANMSAYMLSALVLRCNLKELLAELCDAG